MTRRPNQTRNTPNFTTALNPLDLQMLSLMQRDLGAAQLSTLLAAALRRMLREQGYFQMHCPHCGHIQTARYSTRTETSSAGQLYYRCDHCAAVYTPKNDTP